ncbi:MAG: NADH:flavin oxidoreductase/NADH oxidase [Proteobacteria bacterium]|nr:NADH:flavin oxidoreductase/NADH oxidase [Pseudomonadota bacterium]
MGSLLFSPFPLRGLTLPNRIVVSPMGQYSADDGCAGAWHLMHLGHLALSGAGLLITEATAIHPEGRISKHDMGMWDDRHAAALEPVIAFCRRHGGAHLGMQLYHAGRKASVTVAWEAQRPIATGEGGWTIHAPSALAYPGRLAPEPLSEVEIAQLVGGFAAAAARADRLGLDLIEIHGAHGYLIHSFLSPLSNQRSDRYGGSLDNRCRFALEVFDAIRAVWPERKPLGMRISATDWADGGWTIEDSVHLARQLKARGCDFITASSGGTTPAQKLTVGPGYQVPLADRIRRDAGIATMAVGLITEPRQAEAILTGESADLVALARGMLFNPRWPWHAAMELGERVFYPKQYERSHPSMRGGDFLKPVRDA